MLEFLFGAVVAGFFLKGRHHRRRGCGPRGGWARYDSGSGSRRGGRRRGRSGLERAASEVFKRKLDIDEDQEDLVDHALRDLMARLRELRAVLVESRPEVADAFRGETVDDAALAAIFEQHDSEVTRLRREIVSALKQVHAVLDEEQRERAAELMSSGQSWR